MEEERGGKTEAGDFVPELGPRWARGELAAPVFVFTGASCFWQIFWTRIWGEGGAFKPPSDLKLFRLPAVQLLAQIGQRAQSIGKIFN